MMKISMTKVEWRKIIDLLIDDSLNTDKLDILKDCNEFTLRVNIIDKLVTEFAGEKDAEH